MTAGEGAVSLEGKTIVVTGASSGIGRAVAARLAGAGAWVAMVARREEPLARAAEEVGGHPVPADISSATAVHRLAEYLTELLGDGPELVVNAAGSFSLAPIAETDPEVFRRQVDVNLVGAFLVMRAFLPGMLERDEGSLVSVGSIAGRVAMPGNGAYGASKFGLRGLHEVLLQEIVGTGVRATLLEPAATDTPLWDPLDPDGSPHLPSRSAMLRPEDVADAVLWTATRPAGVRIPYLAIHPAG